MVDKETVQSGYDDLGKRYCDERTTDDEDSAILDQFLASVPAEARILDAGCGPGAILRDQLADSFDPVGLDLSRQQLVEARTTISDTPLVQGDMSHLPFRTNSFDAITALHSIIHLPLAEHQEAIEEFARILAPDGRLLLTEGTSSWQGSNPDWLDSGVEMAWQIAGPEQTREQLRSAGFGVVDESTARDELADEDAQWLFFTAELA